MNIRNIPRGESGGSVANAVPREPSRRVDIGFSRRLLVVDPLIARMARRIISEVLEERRRGDLVLAGAEESIWKTDWSSMSLVLRGSERDEDGFIRSVSERLGAAGLPACLTRTLAEGSVPRYVLDL